MYALPAVAFQMLVPELYDGRYIPAAARAVDRAFQRDSRRYDRGFSLY